MSTYLRGATITTYQLTTVPPSASEVNGWLDRWVDGRLALRVDIMGVAQSPRGLHSTGAHRAQVPHKNYTPENTADPPSSQRRNRQRNRPSYCASGCGGDQFRVF